MKNERILITGNWKMAPLSVRDAKKTFTDIKKSASKMQYVQTVVCPPFLYVPELARLMSGHRCVVGAQDVFWEKEGAYTGEVSAAQLVDMKAKYVIVGHSERRALGEIDEMASRKVVAATKVGLNVILCVGERERDDHGEYTRFIAEELRMSLAGLSKQFLKQVVIAYEPIWAIGKNALRTASPEDVFEVVILIKKVLTDMYGAGVAESTTILYGGSVDARNASDFLKVEGVGGLLVGRASLNPKTFSNILLAANTIARERK